MKITAVCNRCLTVASFLVIQGGDTVGEVARDLIEEVHAAVFDLMELIRAFQSKNKLSKVFMSTLFKRRQEELDAVVDRAVMRLQVSGVVTYGWPTWHFDTRQDVWFGPPKVCAQHHGEKQGAFFGPLQRLGPRVRV